MLLRSLLEYHYFCRLKYKNRIFGPMVGRCKICECLFVKDKKERVDISYGRFCDLSNFVVSKVSNMKRKKINETEDEKRKNTREREK